MTNDVWQNRIVGEGLVAAGELVAHPQNWRKHPKEQGKQLAAGLGKVGWVQRVIVNKRTGRMLDGHLRAELARTQGEETPVPVVYVDLSEDEERTVLATLDPIAGMAIADEATLAGLVRSIEDADLRSIAGSMAQTLNVDVDGTGEAGRDTEAQVDRAEELRQKWGVEPGQLWQLGEHRLICGDCTDAAVVARVMGGEKAGCCVTDPPYGQDQADVPHDSPEEHARLMAGCVSAMPIENGIVIAFQSPRMFPDWLAAIRPHKFLRALWLYKEAQETFPWHGWIMKSEMILVSEIGTGKWIEVHPYAHDCYKVSEVSFRTEKLAAVRPHGSVKPLTVIQDLVSRVGGDVYEPFSGSGTTLIACENLGRRCRAVEIAPGYVAVALERWATHTGKVPVLVESTPSGGDGDAVKAGAGA